MIEKEFLVVLCFGIIVIFCTNPNLFWMKPDWNSTKYVSSLILLILLIICIINRIIINRI